LIQEISKRKNGFRDDYKEVENKKLLKQMIPGDIGKHMI